jgi:hypothetical protein
MRAIYIVRCVRVRVRGVCVCVCTSIFACKDLSAGGVLSFFAINCRGNYSHSYTNEGGTLSSDVLCVRAEEGKHSMYCVYKIAYKRMTVYTDECVHAFTYMHIFFYIRIYLPDWVHMYCVCACTCVCMCVGGCVCMYIYIYNIIYIYIYTRRYGCAHTCA